MITIREKLHRNRFSTNLNQILKSMQSKKVNEIIAFELMILNYT